MLKPLNLEERKKTQVSFGLLYALSLLVFGAGVWAFLRVPEMVSDSESGRFKKIVSEQGPLVGGADSISKLASQLILLDGAYASAADEIAKGQARTRVEETESKITSQMSVLTTEANAIVQKENKMLSQGITTLTRALETYRHTIGELRRTLTEKGIDVQRLTDIQTQINQKDMEINMLKMQVMAAGSRGGGGGGSADPTAKELEFKLGVVQRNLRDCQAGKAGADVATIQKQLDDCQALKGSGKGITFREAMSYATAEAYLQVILHDGGSKKEQRKFFIDAKESLEALEQSTRSPELKTKVSTQLAVLNKNKP